MSVFLILNTTEQSIGIPRTRELNVRQYLSMFDNNFVFLSTVSQKPITGGFRSNKPIVKSQSDRLTSSSAAFRSAQDIRQQSLIYIYTIYNKYIYILYEEIYTKTDINLKIHCQITLTLLDFKSAKIRQKIVYYLIFEGMNENVFANHSKDIHG